MSIQRSNASVRRFAIGTSLLSLAMLCASAASAQAQDAPAQDTAQNADDGSGLGDIVVTAQFRSTNVQDTPVAITAVSADMLARRSQTNISQIAAQAPNVTLKPQAGVWGPSIATSIRGIGGQIDPHPAFSPGVGMYIDDVFYTSTVGAVFDLLDLDRVEILRGPQGTNAGANSIGGAVKLYTRKPNGEGGFAEATYGSRNRIDLRASGDLTLVPDAVFVRISGVSKSQRGYVKRIDYACSHPGSGLPTFVTGNDCLLGTMGGVDYKAVRGAVRILPTSNLEVNVSADVIQDDSEMGGVVWNNTNNILDRVKLNGVPYDARFSAPDPYTNYSSYYMPGGVIEGVPNRTITATPRQQYKSWGTAGTIDWEPIAGIKIKSITAYRKSRAQWVGDVDGSPLGLGLDFQDIDNRQFSQETRLSGKLADGAIEYTLGGYYLHRWAAYRPRQYFIYQSPSYDFTNNDRIKNDSVAGFANVAWHVTDKFNLVGGLRYTHETKSFALRRYTQTGAVAPGYEVLDTITSRYKKGTWDWSISADYKLTPDIMGYASVATGYRSGGNTPRPFAPDQALPFGPESTVNYELGLKNTLFDRKLRLNLAAFYSTLKDVQFTLLTCPQISTFPTCGVTANAGDAEVKGVEAEMTAEPVDGLLIDGSVSYLKFRYTRVNPSAGTQVVRAYSPDWKWSVGAQYEFDLGAMGSLTPRLDASYTSEVFSSGTPRPTARIAPYTLANARLTWRDTDRAWEFALEVTNLTDKVYYVSNADLSFIPVIGFSWNAPGRPREWALTVKRNF
ncbi:TonB-dependent receptor [Sphingobium nicotianae]|uniref:TonB-dependent receptor n=1 Tax=Sphingobium nicotianae TaxID=2782607 RepID=A0A9X1DDH7_9SPHN|nr:TonB-dependent receptor [Sphingobium nicotianae]MBT2187879.1 TonB-dependent receptor [Sphingobium nicotianae]